MIKIYGQSISTCLYCDKVDGPMLPAIKNIDNLFLFVFAKIIDPIEVGISDFVKFHHALKL